MELTALEKKRLRTKKWKAANPDKVRLAQRRWHKVNPDKDGQYKINRQQRYPWLNSYAGARQRCKYPKHNRFSCYGGRGIEFHLTLDEVGVLWLRDDARNMERPSIDRINNDGHYEFDNCRFIESSKNISYHPHGY